MLKKLTRGGLLSLGMVSIAAKTSFPFLPFLSAGLVNFFVLSGGGHNYLRNNALELLSASFAEAGTKTG